MIYPQDLLFINDGNDKMVEGTDLYNFDKMRMIAKVITTLQEYVDCFTISFVMLFLLYILKNISLYWTLMVSTVSKAMVGYAD